MLNKIPGDNFSALRIPFESGRQSPKALGSTLFLYLIMQVFVMALEIAISTQVTFPNKNIILWVHVGVTVIILILALVYSFSAVNMTRQKTQYFIVVLGSQNIALVGMHMLAIYCIDISFKPSSANLLLLVSLTVGLAVLIFLVTSVRLYVLIKKGVYRRDSLKAEKRRKVEKSLYLPAVILGSTGLFLAFQFFIKQYGLDDPNTLLAITFCLIASFAMAFVLPEQLVILYCKYRFKSFNFSKKVIYIPLEGNEGLEHLKPFTTIRHRHHK